MGSGNRICKFVNELEGMNGNDCLNKEKGKHTLSSFVIYTNFGISQFVIQPACNICGFLTSVMQHSFWPKNFFMNLSAELFKNNLFPGGGRYSILQVSLDLFYPWVCSLLQRAHAGYVKQDSLSFSTNDLSILAHMLFLSFILLFVQSGKVEDAKEVISNLWGQSEVNKAMEEFQSVIRNDGGDLESTWLELLEQPHSRGCIKVVFQCPIQTGFYELSNGTSTQLALLGTIPLWKACQRHYMCVLVYNLISLMLNL